MEKPATGSSQSDTGARDAPPAEGKGPSKSDQRKLAVGAAIGIGSAAIVAALLYVNRDRRIEGRPSGSDLPKRDAAES